MLYTYAIKITEFLLYFYSKIPVKKKPIIESAAGDSTMDLVNSDDEDKDVATLSQLVLLNKTTTPEMKLRATKKNDKELMQQLNLEILKGRKRKLELKNENLVLQNYEIRLKVMKMENEMDLPNRFPLDAEIDFVYIE